MTLFLSFFGTYAILLTILHYQSKVMLRRKNCHFNNCFSSLSTSSFRALSFADRIQKRTHTQTANAIIIVVRRVYVCLTAAHYNYYICSRLSIELEKAVHIYSVLHKIHTAKKKRKNTHKLSLIVVEQQYRALAK